MRPLIWLLVVIVVVNADDFYELLGVSRQATTREIRKAFKKMALEMHPDKNQDDPKAHDKFLRINRAYEVLKDEDLRKKYDTHGEEGLKEDTPTGQGYRSWKFYNQEFGIYDDDAEVITLSKSDFEQSVDNTEDVWFINFYSPHCSHCHDLAPMWREMAKELEGVIRIGAVNCEDDYMICRQQRIQSYPSLIMYPQKEKYHGTKTTKQLVKYALQQVRAQVSELWSGNWKSTINDEEKKEKPWLISFCGDGGDCVETSTITKLAAMLDELVNVGEIHCQSNENICDNLGIDYGTYFFRSGEVEKTKGLSIVSLDAKEIALKVLQELPEVTVLDKQTYKQALSDLADEKTESWMMHFVDREVVDLELRKLPALLPDFNVGRVDCSQMKEECDSLHLIEFPVFMVMKRGGSHEIHHGRQTAHDIAAFTRLCSEARVETLGPDDFPNRVVNSGQPWFVDFFAPWCPPCMRLLPEFRKASNRMMNINFGTVDCTVHKGLCSTYKVRSYPTTIFYNESKPHQFQGHHHVDDIMEFLEDTLNPPVIILDETSFANLVDKKDKNDIWLIDYYIPRCGPCQQLAPEWRRLAKMVKDVDNIRVGQINCGEHKALCQKKGAYRYPSIRLYPAGTTDTTKVHQYSGWFRDAPSIRAWAFEFLPSSVEVLNYAKFKSILKSTTPWIIDFYTPWCGHCQVFAPEFEKVAKSMDGFVKAGKVDCDTEGYLCQEAGIGAYPTVRFYRGAAKSGKKQGVYGEEIDSQEADYIMSYLKKSVKTKKKITTKDEL